MKVYIETLGCPKNVNDSEMAAGILTSVGYKVTKNINEADTVLINTCGFINDAKKESIEAILETAKIKESREMTLVVSGCLSQRYINDLFDEMPEVDFFLGVNDYEQLPEILKQKQRQKFINTNPGVFYDFQKRISMDEKYTRTVKIAEGCDNVCAYCVIPSIRGKFRSRTIEDIVNESELLAKEGCVELILIAQDVTNYGTDIYGEKKLPELIKAIARIPQIHWIRLMYCYEDRVTDELIEIMQNEPKVCKYIDMPIQHYSDNILRAMRRRSGSDSIKNTIERLRSNVEDIHIRTTLITGFPGETEEDFDSLYEFVSRAKFDRLGVFAYSQEENTVAGEMENQVDEEVKEARRDSIMRKQIEISLEKNTDKIGKIFEILVEGMDETGAYYGRTQYDAPGIDNSVIFSSDKELKPGEFVNVRITDAYDYDLVGEVEE